MVCNIKLARLNCIQSMTGNMVDRRIFAIQYSLKEIFRMYNMVSHVFIKHPLNESYIVR